MNNSKRIGIFQKKYLKKNELFFNKIIKEFNIEKKEIDIVAVLHLLPDAIPFVQALENIGNIKYIIAKPKTINSKILGNINKKRIKVINKREISIKIKKLKNKTIFMDMGGYFSSFISQLKNESNFIGVVEDTENGLQKYEKLNIEFPFLSVARSPLKDNEDYMVGSAIVYSVERILRNQNIIIGRMKSGVIGFGKIGTSVSENLLKRGSNVSVFDKNNIRLLKSSRLGFKIRSKNSVLKSSDLICLATGNMSLTKRDFKKIKNGAFIFSVTSSDDEFDKKWLENNYKKKEVSSDIVEYSNKEHFFYLLNDGETVNFTHGTTVGEYILLVHAELLVSVFKLFNFEKSAKCISISNKERSKIAKIWLDIFRLK